MSRYHRSQLLLHTDFWALHRVLCVCGCDHDPTTSGIKIIDHQMVCRDLTDYCYYPIIIDHPLTVRSLVRTDYILYAIDIMQYEVLL